MVITADLRSTAPSAAAKCNDGCNMTDPVSAIVPSEFHLARSLGDDVKEVSQQGGVQQDISVPCGVR